jgi:ABC-type antimicrobial peptide transport system permease subunit
LAGVGIYGVMSSSVAQRSAGIGIRMALGARRGTVLWMVLRETVAMLLAGLAIGVPAVLAAGRSLSSLLFGLKPADPAVIAAAVLVISTAALLVGCVPARRASRIDPMRALRQD